MSMTTESMSVVPMLVGQYRKGEALEFLPFSLIEIERAKHAALRILQGFHFRTWRTVLITSLCNEPTQFLPIERAVQSYGLVTTMADAFTFDAGRVESTIRRFDTAAVIGDRKSTRLNSSHVRISYAVFCLKKKNKTTIIRL